MIIMELENHVDGEVMGAALRDIKRSFAGKRHGIIVDTLDMRTYDIDAQRVFIAWVNENSDQIVKVAVVSDKSVWHMVISTMVPLIDVPLKIFYEMDDAKTWVREN